MAQLKDTLVSGNLRVTDTILADILQADSIKGGIVATGTTWNGNTIDEIYGGTGQNTYTKGDLLYASAANTLSKLGANNTGTKQFLSMTSSVPSWASIAFADIPSLYIGTTKVQSSSAAQALTGITTLTTSSNATIGGTITVGGGGFIGSTAATNIYLSNSSGNVFVVDGKVVRRNASITDVTLGSSTYRWGGLYSTTGSFSSTLGVTGNTTLGGALSVTELSTLSGGITLGGTYNSADSKLVWDSDHSAWHLIGNFYADGFVSSGGLSTGSGTSGIDEPGMWLALSKSTTDKIHISHMPYVAGSASDLTTGTSTTATVWGAKTIADYVQSQVNTSVTSALYFRGESSTAITNGGTETATINGSSLTAKTGDLVLYDGKEFAWDGTKWIQLGDESSWASKTTKIEGTGYLSGGGTLESNRTIDIGTTYKTKIDNGATAYGYFSNNILPVSHGGTGKSTWTQYGIVYASASGTLAQIALPTWAASTTYWLKATTNSSKVPTYSLATLSKSDVGLGNVENTALSTWAGTNKITTVGTVTTGTWNATAISAKYGGTGMSGDNAFTGAYRIVYTSSATAMTTLAPNTTSTKKFLTMTGTGSAGQAPAWGTIAQSDVLGSSAIGDSKKFVYYDATNGLVATTQTLGTATKPLYLSSGTLTEGSTYAGGTAITLNGTSKASSTASFYAPTASGTVSEVLLSGGANASPTWAKQSSLSTGFHPKALTSKGTTATTTAGETYGVAGDSTSGKRIFTKWFVNLDNGETDLIDGMIITFRMPTAGLGTVGECITIDGNEQHFHQVVYNTNTLLTTHFAVNSVITVQYDSTISSNSYGKYNSSTGTYVHNGNTTTAIKGVWRVLSLYDSGNTDVRYHQTIYYPLRTVATGGAIRRYTLCMMTMDGKMTSLRTSAEDTTNSTTLANTTYNSTTKTMFSGYLNPRKIYYWNHTDNYAAGSNITRNNTMLTHDGELIDYRYTLNCSTTLTARSNLYIVGTIDDNGFKLDPTTPWSCTLPSTEDGKVYIYVGMVHTDTAGYRGTLEENNTAYWYKDGAVRVYNYYSVKAETATKLSTVSKTAWGQTYWTSNGVPDTISGNMSSVGNISMSGSISGATTGSFSSNVTVGGNLTLSTNTNNINVTNTSGTAVSAMYLSSANNLIIGRGTGAAGNLYLEGKTVELRYGASHTTSLVINESGNMQLGGTLQVGTTSANKATTLNGPLSVTGLSTLAGGAKLTTTKKIWFGDDYYLELDSNGYIHTNAGFYSDSFVSAGGLNEDSSGASGIDLDAMWQSLKNTSDTHGSDKIAAAHIPDLSETYQTKYGFTITGTSGASYNLANFVTSSGVTSVATGTGLTGGTITSTGTISINSTYQTYISHGESAYNSLGNYLPLSGGTIASDSFGVFHIQRNHTTNAAAIGFKHYSSGTTVEQLGYIGMTTKNGSLMRWNYNSTTSYTILDSENSSVSLSGSTLTVKINGVSKSLTNTTYSSQAAASGGTAVSLVTTGEKYNWNTAYGWGNHASAGYVKSSGVTSITLTSGTGITVSSSGTAITGTGTRTISLNVEGAKTALGLGSMAYASTSSYQPAGSYVKYSTTPPANANITDGTNPTMYLLHKDQSTTANTPNSYGLLADFTVSSGHLQFASGLTQNEIKVRSYWWTNRSSTSDPFPGYPSWVTLLHSGNYSSYALPLSGGTMSGAIKLPANVSIDNSANNASVLYHNGTDTFIGMTNTGTVRIKTADTGIWHRRYTSGSAYTDYSILDTGNYSSYALPLAGGTMTGAIKLPSNVGLDNSANNVSILFHDSTNTFIGMANSGSVYIRTSNTNIAHRKYTSGSAYTDYTVYDSGNSNLNTVDWTCKNLSVGNDSQTAWVATTNSKNCVVSINHGSGYGIFMNSKATTSDVYLLSLNYGATNLSTTGTTAFTVRANGNVGVNITNPSYQLHCNGTLGVNDAATFGSTLTVSGLTTISNHLICGVSAASASGTWSDGLDVWTYNTNSIAWAANFKNLYNNGTTNPYGVGIKLSTSSGSETSKYWGIATVNVSGWGNDLKLSFYYSTAEKAKIDASGNFSAVGNVAAGTASDERLKTNIQTLSIDSAKDIILKARPVNFTWKDIATEFYDGYKGDDIGLIAQEVEDLLPQAIGTIYEKYKRLDYTKFIPPIITVIQDHEKRIKELEDIIAKLTEENEHLKEQI